jgi:hypothetical protein
LYPNCPGRQAAGHPFRWGEHRRAKGFSDHSTNAITDRRRWRKLFGDSHHQSGFSGIAGNSNRYDEMLTGNP